MSPLPETVSRPWSWVKPAGWSFFSQSVCMPLPPTSVKAHPPGRSTLSKTAVAWVNRACTRLPPRGLATDVTLCGDATNSPMSTDLGRFFRVAVPTVDQVAPSVEAYAVIVSPARARRSQEALAGPALSSVKSC
jgi:hypothetical protein